MQQSVTSKRRDNPFNLKYHHNTNNISVHYYRPCIYQSSVGLCVLCGLWQDSDKHMVVGISKVVG